MRYDEYLVKMPFEVVLLLMLGKRYMTQQLPCALVKYRLISYRFDRSEFNCLAFHLNAKPRIQIRIIICVFCQSQNGCHISNGIMCDPIQFLHTQRSPKIISQS